MKPPTQPIPVATIYNWKKKIDPRPDYQRPEAWTTKQRQLLVDSILRGYDIPKMYWRKVQRDDGIEYEVIDGQQRLLTIWSFKEGKFALAKDADPVDEEPIANKKCEELNMETHSVFDTYAIDVVIVENDDEDEIKEMFLRLQNGTTLKAQEKRNAMPGEMRDFVKNLATHKFLENCAFSNSRFTFDHVIAQLVRLELEGGPANIQNSHLNRMYTKYKKFEDSNKVERKIRRVLDYLCRVFPKKTPELERHSVMTLYCLASALLEKFVHEGTEPKLYEWFIAFEKDRREQDKLEEDERDIQLSEYKNLTGHSTDAEHSIRGRLEIFERKFFLKFPDIEPIDPNRSFAYEQRLAIYRKNDGCCQIKKNCDGKKLDWDADWHADHIVPHSKGGKTIVSNGQVACSACNLSKGNSVS